MADKATTRDNDNWSSAGVVGLFDSAQLQRAQRRHRWHTLLLCTLVTVLLGIPLLTGWRMLQDARRQTLVEEFVILRPAADQLPHRHNPAVATLLNEADSLREHADNGTVAESVVALRQALQKLSEVRRTDHDIQRIRPLHNPLGIALNKTPWLDSSAVIKQRVKELNQRHGEVAEHPKAGETTLAEQKLVALLSDVCALLRDNVRAMQTSTTRQNWIRLHTFVSNHLPDDEPGWPVIRDVAMDASNGWDDGDWEISQTLFARASERLRQFLERDHPAIFDQLQESHAEALARMATEKSGLQKHIKELEKDKNQLSAQLATANSQRLQAEKDAKGDAENGSAPQRQETTNSLGMRLVLIPAGTFSMGSSSEDRKRDVADFPDLTSRMVQDELQHDVRITRSFELSAYETTVGQFRKFVNATGNKTTVERKLAGGYGWDHSSRTFKRQRKYNWRNPGFDQTDDHPVVNVTRDDAEEFCKWLTREEGRVYRLPTEAEWEYACRAGSRGRYSFGNSAEDLVSFGNVGDSTAREVLVNHQDMAYLKSEDGSSFTAPVGQFKPSPWGLFDMHGNVTEWVVDDYDDYDTLPLLSTDPWGSGTYAVTRGGNYSLDGGRCRSAYRFNRSPSDTSTGVGFRVVRTIALLIKTVYPRTAATKLKTASGGNINLESGDGLIAIDGQVIKDADHFERLVGAMPRDAAFTMTIIDKRRGQELELNGRLDQGGGWRLGFAVGRDR